MLPHAKVNGSMIRSLRIISGMSTQMLVDKLAARGVSISPQALRNLEIGRTTPRPEVFDAIARTLRVSRVDLLIDPPLELIHAITRIERLQAHDDDTTDGLSALRRTPSL